MRRLLGGGGVRRLRVGREGLREVGNDGGRRRVVVGVLGGGVVGGGGRGGGAVGVAGAGGVMRGGDWADGVGADGGHAAVVQRGVVGGG